MLYRRYSNQQQKKSVYRKEEPPYHTPKTTQYNISDSCFYLTLELSPKFQKSGEKADLSLFLFCDSLPSIGDKFPIIPVTFDDDNPIKQWTKETGNAAILQIDIFQKQKTYFPKSFYRTPIMTKEWFYLRLSQPEKSK